MRPNPRQPQHAPACPSTAPSCPNKALGSSNLLGDALRGPAHAATNICTARWAKGAAVHSIAAPNAAQLLLLLLMGAAIRAPSPLAAHVVSTRLIDPLYLQVSKSNRRHPYERGQSHAAGKRQAAAAGGGGTGPHLVLVLIQRAAAVARLPLREAGRLQSGLLQRAQGNPQAQPLSEVGKGAAHPGWFPVHLQVVWAEWWLARHCWAHAEPWLALLGLPMNVRCLALLHSSDRVAASMLTAVCSSSAAPAAAGCSVQRPCRHAGHRYAFARRNVSRATRRSLAPLATGASAATAADAAQKPGAGSAADSDSESLTQRMFRQMEQNQASGAQGGWRAQGS